MDTIKPSLTPPELLPSLVFTEHLNDHLFKAGNDGSMLLKSPNSNDSDESELTKLGFPVGPELIFRA